MSKLDRIAPDTLAGNPRATLAQWKRYSHIVHKARELDPRPWEMRLVGLAPATAASRLRDAIRGAIAFHYTDDTDGLMRWYDSVIITHTSTHLIIRSKDMPKTVPEVKAVLDEQYPFQFDTLALDEFHAFGVLLQTGRIVGPVHIRRPHADQLESHWPNVEIIPSRDGSLLML